MRKMSERVRPAVERGEGEKGEKKKVVSLCENFFWVELKAKKKKKKKYLFFYLGQSRRREKQSTPVEVHHHKRQRSETIRHKS